MTQNHCPIISRVQKISFKEEEECSWKTQQELKARYVTKNDKGDLIKAFQPEDKFALRKKADSNVIATVANKILVDTNYEEAEKK